MGHRHAGSSLSYARSADGSPVAVMIAFRLPNIGQRCAPPSQRGCKKQRRCNRRVDLVNPFLGLIQARIGKDFAGPYARIKVRAAAAALCAVPTRTTRMISGSTISAPGSRPAPVLHPRPPYCASAPCSLQVPDPCPRLRPRHGLRRPKLRRQSGCARHPAISPCAAARSLGRSHKPGLAAPILPPLYTCTAQRLGAPPSNPGSARAAGPARRSLWQRY